MVVQAVAITAQMCQMKDTQHLAHLQWKPGAGPAQLSSHCSRHRGPRPASSCRAKTPLKYTGMGFIIIFRLRRNRDSPWAASKSPRTCEGSVPQGCVGGCSTSQEQTWDGHGGAARNTQTGGFPVHLGAGWGCGWSAGPLLGKQISKQSDFFFFFFTQSIAHPG